MSHLQDGVPGVEWVEAVVAVKCPVMHRIELSATHNKELSKNVNSVDLGQVKAKHLKRIYYVTRK